MRPGRRVVVALALVALTLAVYLPVAGFDFLNYDDDLYVTANRAVREGLTAKGVLWALTATHASNWHPLTWVSHMIDRDLFGLDPGAHHAVNLVFHLLAAVLLYWVLAAMTGSTWRSALVAALFALHPLHVESVAWVAERKDVLSTCLWALTLLLYLRYARRPGVARYLAVLGSFAVGLAAKPMVLTLPLLLFLFDFWPLGRLAGCGAAEGAGRPRLPLRRLLAEKAPLAALSATSAAITWYAQKQGVALEMTENFSLWGRSANALVSYARYLGKALLPTHLAVFYPHPAGTLPLWQAAAAGVLVVAATLLFLRFAARFPWLLVGWVWYLVTLLPVIGFIQVGSQAMADRYTYVPLTGIFLLSVWGANALRLRHPGSTRYAVALGVAAVAVMAVVSRVQLNHWRNSCSLFEHALEVTTGNAVAHNNLGYCLLEQGRFEEARRHLEQALELKPAYADAYANLGIVLARLGRASEAESRLRESLLFDPGRAANHLNLSNVMLQLGRVGEAEGLLREALRLDPDLAMAHSNLCVLLSRKGEVAAAIAECREALRIDAGHAQAGSNLDRLLRGEAL